MLYLGGWVFIAGGYCGRSKGLLTHSGVALHGWSKGYIIALLHFGVIRIVALSLSSIDDQPLISLNLGKFPADYRFSPSVTPF